MKPAFRICLFFFVGYFGILYSSLCQVLSEDEKAIQDQAIQHFEKKEYKESMFFINRLLKIYPKDPFFNYYSGVSLTELENDLEAAIYQLKLASLKDVPQNVYFYLGKAFHLSEDFDKAIKYYERFIDFGDRPEVKSLHTERLLEMCRRRKDPNYKRSIQTLKRQETKIEKEEPIKEADEKDQPSAEMKKPVHIEKPPVHYNSLLDQALDFQVKADSTRRLADEKREQLENISGEEKRSKTEEEILELEKQAFEFQKLADEKYTLVREIEQKRLASQILTKKKEQSDNEQKGKETTPGSGSVSDEAGIDVMNQIIDDFYLTEEFKDIFKKNELNALSDLVVINKEANKAMIDARKIQRDLEKETVVANAAQSKKENKRALKKIANLEKRIFEKKFYAIDSYREVNDIRYRIFKEKINFLREGEATKGIVKQAQEYQKNAEISYQKVLALRNEAEKANQANRKYDKLAIANTYEILALENQKNALATFAGILPVKDQKRKIRESLTRVSDQQRKMDTISADLKREKALREKRTDITKISKTETKGISEAPKKSAERKKTEDDRPGQARFERERRSEIQEFKYEFTILKTSPYSASNPIPVNVTLPERVVYRIQLAVFKNPIPPDYFKGLSPVLAEIIPESGLTRYYTGTFRKFVDAQAALPAVQNLGFQDGFIVAHFMGKKISLNRARNLESADDSFNKDQKTHPDSVKNKSRETGRMTYNLIIKVKVGAYKDQVSEEKMDSFRKMAQDKKVEFYLNKNGLYVYTIGIFFTFDKAEKFKDLLVVNGFRDAAVAAFIGKSEIPVEEAKKLSGM